MGNRAARRWPVRWLALVVLAASPAGCAEARDGADPQPSSATPSPTTTRATEPGTGVPKLRLEDDGAHVELHLGGTAVILLPAESWRWTDPVVAGPAVTVSEDVSDAAATSRSWTVTARKPGRATVTLAGSPACRSATPPCAAPDRRWRVRITVR